MGEEVRPLLAQIQLRRDRGIRLSFKVGVDQNQSYMTRVVYKQSSFTVNRVCFGQDQRSKSDIHEPYGSFTYTFLPRIGSDLDAYRESGHAVSLFLPCPKALESYLFWTPFSQDGG